MNALVGYTGFVGSNIYAQGTFDEVYNSSNIESAYGTCPDLLIYAGMRAEKYLANNAPDKDMDLVYQAERNIQMIQPKKLVLISTIDVFKHPIQVDEMSDIDEEGLHAYGLNRYRLECWVRQNYPDAVIIRLPGLFGKNIKKNFIFDYINVIPFMLKADKFQELSKKNDMLLSCYTMQDNGFYRCNTLTESQRERLKNCFQDLNFTAINFTDSRSVYQFYPLDRLWKDIQICLDNNILLFHPATEPVSAAEIYTYMTGRKFENILNGQPVNYDYRTIYGKLFGGSDCYIMDKENILNQINEFVVGEGKK